MDHVRDDGQPGTRRFRIWVQGRLDEGFSEGLDGIEQQDVPAGTMFSGVVVDQSQLHSTLDLLRSLGIGVLRFEVDPPCVPRSTGPEGHSEDPGEAMCHGHPHEATERPTEREQGHDQGDAR